MAKQTPLDVLLDAMREYAKDAATKKEAVAAARAAAPYVHGRAPVARRGVELAEVPDDELDGWDGGEGEEGGEEESGGAGPSGADQR